MGFFERIQSKCKEKGTSIHKIEMELGFSNGYIKSADSKIQSDRLDAIAKRLDTPIDYFISGKSIGETTMDYFVENMKFLDNDSLQRIMSYAEKYIELNNKDMGLTSEQKAQIIEMLTNNTNGNTDK